MKILVTGASGTIGSALASRLETEGHDVYRQSRVPRPSHEGKWLTFEFQDARRALADQGDWDVVFHLAGLTSTAAAREAPQQALMDNVGGLITLLEAVRSENEPPFVAIAGTATQVGLPPTSVIDERLDDDPVTFYDVTKLAAEMFLKQYVREGWVRGCCLRLATVYGASGRSQASDRGIIDRVMRKALQGEALTVYGDGNYLRDYIHVQDVVEAFMAAAAHPENVDGKAFVIGTGKGVSVGDAFRCAAAIAEEMTGRPIEVKHIPAPEGMSPIEFRNAIIDATEFRAATGWEPRYDLETGLRATYVTATTT